MTTRIFLSISFIFALTMIVNQIEMVAGDDLQLGRGMMISGDPMDIPFKEKNKFGTNEQLRKLASEGSFNKKSEFLSKGRAIAKDSEEQLAHEDDEQLHLEKTFADKLGGQHVKAILGQTAGAIDQLIYGTLLGRYKYHVTNGKIRNLQLSENLLPDMGVVVDNKRALLLQYGSLFADGVLRVNLINKGRDEEEYSLQGDKGAVVAKIKFRIDKDGRVTEVENTNSN